MALDEALLQRVALGESPPILRFYRWQPTTVTIGYAQSVAKDLDLEVCRQEGLDVVRRTTGGRAVLHDHEVTYAVIAPLNTGKFAHDVLSCYRVIAEVLQETLQQLGLPAELVPGKPRGGHSNPAKAVCFSAPSQYELVISGRKVAGSAQKRHGQAFLQHGSLPLEMDLELLRRVLRIEDRKLMESVGWLNLQASEPLDIATVESRLTEVFRRQLQIEWEHSEPSALEDSLAQLLLKEKFGNPEWNLKH